MRLLPAGTEAEIPIAALTANAFRENIQKAGGVGMNGHIAKALDVTKMVEILRRVLGDRKYNHAAGSCTPGRAIKEGERK